jgi:hypothetical protein
MKINIHKIEKSKIREEMKSDGAFDGRYKTKSLPNKKKWKREKFNLLKYDF